MFQDRILFNSGLIQRCPEIHENPDQISKLLSSNSKSKIIPFWQEKPLVLTDGQLCWLNPNHKLFSRCKTTVFLGFHNGLARFASSVSDQLVGCESEMALGNIQDDSTLIHPEAPKNTKFLSLRSVMSNLSAENAEFAAIAKILLNWHDTHLYCPKCGEPVVMTAAGWQQYCRKCQIQYFCRTNPVVIMLVTFRNSVLLARSKFWPKRMHSLIAGFVDVGETIESAISRESNEEVGIEVSNIRYLASQPWPFPSSLMIGFSAQAKNDKLRIDYNELENAQWVSRERMLKIFTGMDDEITQPRQGTIAEHMLMIWLQGRTGTI